MIWQRRGPAASRNRTAEVKGFESPQLHQVVRCPARRHGRQRRPEVSSGCKSEPGERASVRPLQPEADDVGAEALLAGAVVLELIAEHAGAVDAVAIAAFGDPGLAGAR